jgi:hypothetical protein
MWDVCAFVLIPLLLPIAKKRAKWLTSEMGEGEMGRADGVRGTVPTALLAHSPEYCSCTTRRMSCRYAVDDALAEVNADLAGVNELLESEKQARMDAEAALAQAQGANAGGHDSDNEVASLQARVEELEVEVDGVRERLAEEQRQRCVTQGVPRPMLMPHPPYPPALSPVARLLPPPTSVLHFTLLHSCFFSYT